MFVYVCFLIKIGDNFMLVYIVDFNIYKMCYVLDIWDIKKNMIFFCYW